jgi:hypothetical protein
MPIIENTRTSRITGPDSVPAPTPENPRARQPFPGGPVQFLPAEVKGEGRSALVISSKAELSQERYDACMRDTSLLKLFKAGILKSAGYKGDVVTAGVTTTPSAPDLTALTEADAVTLLKRFPHLAAQTGTSAPGSESTHAGDGEAPKDVPAAQPQQPNQRPQGNSNQRR